MVTAERLHLLLRLLRGPPQRGIHPRRGRAQELIDLLASLLHLTLLLKFAQHRVHLALVARGRDDLLLELEVRERLLQLAVHDELHPQAHRGRPHKIGPHVRLVIVDGTARVRRDVSGRPGTVKGHATLPFLGHLHRCAPIREGNLHANNLARAAAMRRSDEKVLRLKIAPNDARLFQLVQTLSHLKHDVELDRGGEGSALSRHEILEVTVGTQLRHHGEADALVGGGGRPGGVSVGGTLGAGVSVDAHGDRGEACEGMENGWGRSARVELSVDRTRAAARGIVFWNRSILARQL